MKRYSLKEVFLPEQQDEGSEAKTMPPPPDMPSREKSPKGKDVAADMMAALIDEMGSKDFAKAFLKRMGGSGESDVRSVLSYIAKQAGYGFSHYTDE